MKTYSRKGNGLVVVAGVLALQLGGRADTIVQNFTASFGTSSVPIASPLGVPTINTTWNVPQYNGFGGLQSLSAVKYEVNTQIFYRGVLIANGSSLPYTLQVRSDFNFDLPSWMTDVTNLDPTITLSGTSPGSTLTSFNVPGTPSSNSIAQSTLGSPTAQNVLAADLFRYVGGATVPVTVTGDLLTSALGGYHNNSDLGLASPYVFVNNVKVFPVFGVEEFSLVATLVVTYTVPEASTYGAAGALLVLAGGMWVRSRRRESNP